MIRQHIKQWAIEALGLEDEFNCTFKDSILVDDETERQNDRADVSLGAMQLWEYRMKHYAEDEETAKKMVVQQADVIED